MTRENLLIDSHGRVLRDLRVSITDRCNFRCMYCLPETEAAANFYRGRWAQGGFHPEPINRQWVPRTKILSFEEIERSQCRGGSLSALKIWIDACGNRDVTN